MTDVSLIERVIDRVLRPLRRRVEGMIGRAVLELIDSGKGFQVAQVSLGADQLQDGVEVAEPYGFTSRPFVGGEGPAIFVGGTRSHGFVFNIGNRKFRLTGLAEGEVVLYTDEGSQIYFYRGKKIVIKGANEVDIESSKVCVGAASATKGAARKGDPVKVTLNLALIGPMITAPPSGGACIGAGTLDVTGTITAGSASVFEAD